MAWVKSEIQACVFRWKATIAHEIDIRACVRGSFHAGKGHENHHLCNEFTSLQLYIFSLFE